MNQGESIIISAEALKSLREMRYNPSRNITASRLGTILDAYEYGEIREGAMLFEQIAERDDTLKSVKPKREKSVSGLVPVYEVSRNGGALGEEQADVLQNFWGSVRATNAYDRNVSGGLRLLIQQIMLAVSYRYACHHIVWSPRATGLTATFEYVPLWMFENKTGRLRFLKNPYDVNGQDMEPGEWMVTAGEGLMIACSIGWLAKRETYNDWLIFSSRFSTPGVLGRTTHAKGTPEGEAMKQAVQMFGRDLKAVVYGDNGTIKDPIQLVQADGSPNGQPMPALIERVDRKFAALYRGADLGTMSAGSGEGSGASLQGDEALILLDDDRALVEEKIAEISKMVLEWHYGGDVEILASVKLKTREEIKVASDQSAVSSGGKKKDAQKQDERLDAENAVVKKDDDLESLSELLRDGFADVAAVLEEALKATGDERTRLLQEAAAMLPDQIVDDALDAEVTRLLTAAFLGEDQESEEVENGDFKGHPFRGNQWSKRPKGTGKPKKAKRLSKISEVLNAAFDDPDNRDFTDYQQLGVKEIAAIEARAGRVPAEVGSLENVHRTLEAEKAMKILEKHSNDRYPVTEQDFEALPIYLAAPDKQEWQIKSGKTPRLVSTIRRGRDLLIIEEVQTGNQRLTVLSMYRP